MGTLIILFALVLLVLFAAVRHTRANRPVSKTPTYCLHCASVLEKREVAGRLRVACPHCNFVLWDNPKPVAVTLIPKDGGIVLIKRKNNPGQGKWALPGGFIEGYERPHEGASREAGEETHINASINRVLYVFAP